MIYIVLREPTTSGGYVNRFAFSDQRTTLAIDCGGASILPAARITSMSEMTNKLDISQAKGGLGQGVEWSASLADWDGAARTSAGIFDGSARFYGWSVAVARSDSETAAPDWINEVDHWMVTDVSADGATISISVGERWANDGRLLAFGQDGETVPLVVGGHDVWVKTIELKEPDPIFYTCTYGWYQGNPKAPESIGSQERYAGSKMMMLAINPDTGFQESVPAFLFKVQLNADANAFLYATKFPSVGSPPVILQGNEYSFHWQYGVSRTHFQVDAVGDGIHSYLWLQVPQIFYDNESPDNVYFYQGVNSIPLASGAFELIGFGETANAMLPAGVVNASGGLLTFSPSSPTNGGFAAFSLIPSRFAWLLGTDTGSISATELRANYLNACEDVKTNGDKTGSFATLGTNLEPTGGDAFAIWVHFNGGGETSKTEMVLDFALTLPTTPESSGFSKYAVSVKARITCQNMTYFDVPFASTVPDAGNLIEGTTLDIDVPVSDAATVASVSAANMTGHMRMTLVVTSGASPFFAVMQILEASLYGKTIFANGSSYALVRTSAFQFPYGGYSTNDQLDRAAATLIEQLAPYHGITISPASPTFLPTAAQGGECLDASKTYRDNAIALLEETWQVLGVTAYGATPTNGQGLGEIPTPVSIVLGRFEDIVTEPVIEFCHVAGTLTKKAYIAYVDQSFDATSPGKFYGGWGTAPAGADEPEGTDYGYLLWKQCRAAYLVHKVKRGATYQFNGIYDESVVGRMWWESRRNGSRRIEWLCLQPRYLTYSVREAKPLAWSGSAVYIAGTLANYAGYDVSTWDNAGGDTLVVVDRSYDISTGIGKYTVAIPPVPTVDAVAIYRDTLDAAHTIDKLVDTVDATAVTSKYTDTLEA